MSQDLPRVLLELYEDSLRKVVSSVHRYCEQGNPRGMEQMIGRQFGYFWERVVRAVLQSSTQSLQVGPPILFQEFVTSYIKTTIAGGDYEERVADDIGRIIQEYAEASGTSKMDLCDLTLTTPTGKYAIDPKWRFISNDAKTIAR